MKLNKRSSKILMISGVFIPLLLGLIFFIMGDSQDPKSVQDIERFDRDPTLPMPDAGGGVVSIKAIPAKIALANYKKWAQFPPNSRPLRKGYVDIIEHNIIKLAPRPLPILEKDGKIHKSHYSCNLQPRTRSVVEGQRMLLTLFCWSEQEKGAPTPVDLTIGEHRFELLETWNKRKRGLLSGTVNDDGENGDFAKNDKTYTIAWTPRRNDWGYIDFNISFTINDDPKKYQHKLQASFFSSPVAPAKFMGNYNDELRNGSLYISTKIQVKKAGTYRLDANLKTAKGKWVAWANEQLVLKAGLQTVSFRFFGRIFHNREAECPWVLTGLRGIV